MSTAFQAYIRGLEIQAELCSPAEKQYLIRLASDLKSLELIDKQNGKTPFIMNALLVKQILKHSVARWQYQGFGMLRLYLSQDVRLHIWDDDSAVKQVTTIHDHPWSFKSTVICGEITNTIYDRFEGQLPVTHFEQHIKCGPGGHAKEAGELVRLVAHKQETIIAGGSYVQAAAEFHETRSLPGTVTIIERVRGDRNPDEATVMVPLNQNWVSAEPRPATDEEVARFTRKALALLERSL